MKRAIKETAKKIHKTGFFRITDLTENTISFKHSDRVFSFDLRVKNKISGSGLFRSGYVHQWKELGLTFESDYKSMGLIDKAFFSPDFEQFTDNPDFIKRAALYLIGLNHLNA
jgi:isopenicillin N synthase-like dioxygenase